MFTFRWNKYLLSELVFEVFDNGCSTPSEDGFAAAFSSSSANISNESPDGLTEPDGPIPVSVKPDKPWPALSDGSSRLSRARFSYPSEKDNNVSSNHRSKLAKKSTLL